MMTHPALMLELATAVTAARIHDAKQFRQRCRAETETRSIVASRASEQDGVFTGEQVAGVHRAADTRASVLHRGARLHSRPRRAVARRGGNHASRGPS